MKIHALCICLAAVLVPGLFVSATAQGRTVLDKVYSEQQADRGAEQYEAHCAMCHEGNEPDAPPHRGGDFIDHWREAPLDFLFTFIRTNMPGDARGSLSEAAYLDILAHLLRENHYPAGSSELTAGQLGNILMVGLDGPRPLPADALVRVAGCLDHPTADTWSVTSASSPVRVRVGDKTTPEELALSAAAPAGTAVYRLKNADDLKPEALKGQRVQAKGVFSSQGTTSTISLLSLNSAGGTCGK